MVDEARDRDGMGLHRAAAEGVERPSGGELLIADLAALPGDEPASDLEERKRELDELAQRGDGASSHGRPPGGVTGLSGQRLGSRADDVDAIVGPGCLDRRPKEARLLADRIDEDRPLEGHGDREREPGETAATAKVQRGGDLFAAEQRHRAEAVDDVTERDLRRIADRAEVDRRVPGEEQPDVVIDRAARRGAQREVERGEPGIERLVVGVREGRKALNARRERFTRTVQALLLSVVPVRPSGLRSRRRRSSHSDRSLGLP